MHGHPSSPEGPEWLSLRDHQGLRARRWRYYDVPPPTRMRRPAAGLHTASRRRRIGHARRNSARPSAKHRDHLVPPASNARASGQKVIPQSFRTSCTWSDEPPTPRLGRRIASERAEGRGRTASRHVSTAPGIRITTDQCRPGVPADPRTMALFEFVGESLRSDLSWSRGQRVRAARSLAPPHSGSRRRGNNRRGGQVGS